MKCLFITSIPFDTIQCRPSDIEWYRGNEMLVHYLDTIRYLTGDIAQLFCRMDRINPLIAGEDFSVIHARSEAGVSALIDANRISGPLPAEVAFGSMRLEGDS